MDTCAYCGASESGMGMFEGNMCCDDCHAEFAAEHDDGDLLADEIFTAQRLAE